MGNFDPYTPASETDMLAPMEPETNMVTESPRFAKHRTVKNSADHAAPAERSAGMNMIGFNAALISVAPKAGVPNPTIEVLAWNDAIGAFSSFVPRLVREGLGGGVPFIFGCNVGGATIFVAVAAGVASGQEVDIYISGARKFLDTERSAIGDKMIDRVLADTITTTDDASHPDHEVARQDSMAMTDRLASEEWVNKTADDSADVSDAAATEADYSAGVDETAVEATDGIGSEADYSAGVAETMETTDEVIEEKTP